MRWKRSQKKFYLIYFSHPEFIPVEADGEGAKPGRKQTSGSTAGAARWKQMDLHVCVDAGSDISVFTLLRLTHSSQMTDPKLSARTLNTTEAPPNVHIYNTFVSPEKSPFGIKNLAVINWSDI